MLINKDRVYLGLVCFTMLSISIVQWEPAPFEFLMILLLLAAFLFGYFTKLQLKQFLPLKTVICMDDYPILHFYLGLLANPWANFQLLYDHRQTAENQSSGQNALPLNRILMVITKGDLGGAQTHVYDLCSNLKDQLEVHVVVGEYGPLFDKLDALGIKVHIIPPLNREVSFISDWRALQQLTRLVQSLNPDLIAAHSSKAGILSRLAAARTGKPCVFTAHGWAFSEGVSPLKSRVYQMAERFAARRTDRIICVSDYDRLLAVKTKVAAMEQLVTIHNGISMTETKPEARQDQEIRMIMVARFCEPKDHALLFRAVKNLNPNPSFRLQLVGDGPDFNQCKDLAEQLGIAHLVDFLGPRLDVPALLQQADLFVLCSNWEGFPITILEAMRAGLPVVCSDVGGCSEAVVEGETGYLVPRGDLHSLQKRLAELIENQQLRRQMGSAGYTRFTEHFTVDKMVQQTLCVYQKVMTQRSVKL